MSNYTKSTDFASKDSLPSGNSGKIVKGTEIDTEFNNIATAISTKADTTSPSFSGTASFGNISATSVTASSVTASSADISGGTITGITDLAVADGGTGASTAADARANLGTVADTSGNGIAVRTSANTLTARSIAAGTGISVSNGDGVSGNPTITNTGVTSVNGSSGAVTIDSPIKAWVNFDGASATIRASYNVSSVTRNSTGVYTVNFTNAITDANYVVLATTTGQGGDVLSVQGSGNFGSPVLKSTTQVRLNASTGGGSYSDAEECYVAIVR